MDSVYLTQWIFGISGWVSMPIIGYLVTKDNATRKSSLQEYFAVMFFASFVGVAPGKILWELAPAFTAAWYWFGLLLVLFYCIRRYIRPRLK